MNDLLRIADLDGAELVGLLDAAVAAKRDPASVRGSADGRVVAVLFEKPSLRTRFSVEAALARLGAHPIGAYDREVGLGKRESLEDAARVLERYTDAIVVRTFEHSRVETLAEHSSAPVVNALSDGHHPLQALADLMTVAEACADADPRGLKALKLAYVGDGNNVAHSLIEACALTGMEIALACPAGHEPSSEIVAWSNVHGGSTGVTNDPAAAVAGADVVYTDVWASMGQEDEAAQRRARFEGFRITGELMGRAKANAIFLHCLPAHRGEEVDADVIDGPASKVFDQAENRLHTTLAVFVELFKGGG
ncbi:MAG TPA: ornithine carbamoyltransferase [Actinomycetota bacterium]|nr:ornithine carbamoyltransferase [Actinomycetota bacterium]